MTEEFEKLRKEECMNKKELDKNEDHNSLYASDSDSELESKEEKDTADTKKSVHLIKLNKFWVYFEKNYLRPVESGVLNYTTKKQSSLLFHLSSS